LISPQWRDGAADARGTAGESGIVAAAGGVKGLRWPAGPDEPA